MIKRRAAAVRSSAGLGRGPLDAGPFDAGLLDRILDDGAARAAGVRHAVLLSQDGTTLSASRGLSRRDAAHLAEVASGFDGLARSAGRRGRPARVRGTMVETESGTLFVAAVGEGACLVVLSAAGADASTAAGETARLVERVGAYLRALG
ncbi:roadblock/LC7 domain-containing protein [Streptomyces sp. NPDC019937]|uniref:roadblock/LC7 domain-containing protein n=1 Tax=Streptomyces sp. NPDC019937 TaxID=3154787 RepID=UPI0033F88C3F